MLPKWHILFGFAVSYILVYFFNTPLITGLIIFLASFLIDADHYLWYVCTKRNLNPVKAIKWFYKLRAHGKTLTHKERESIKHHILIFHGIELWAVIALLGVIHSFFFWILIGIGTHMVADWAESVHRKTPLYKKISQIAVWEKNKSKRKVEPKD
jgi:hypothetical protein